MPLFVCEKCGCVDNTACGGTFWIVLHKKDNKVLCCECHFGPGKWHNRFPKKIATQSEIKQIKKYWKKNLSSEGYRLIYKEKKNEVPNC